MKRLLAILAVPVIALGSLAAIGFASRILAGTFGPVLGWWPAGGFIVCFMAIAGAFGAEAIHRLLEFIRRTAPASPNRRASRP